MKYSIKITSLLIISLFVANLLADIKIGSITIPSTNMTQSEAHLSIPAIRNAVEEWYHLGTTPYFQELFKKVVAKERQFNDTHYAFYNAYINDWRVPQDLYSKLYAKFYPNVANLKDFRALRWMPSKHIHPQDFLQQELTQRGMVNDNEGGLSRIITSTNLALFGNVGFPGECTMEYFLHRKSHAKPSVDIFKGILGSFGASEAYIPTLMGLADKYFFVEPLRNGKEPETLSQIFIPKDMVDNVAYVAWVQGVPYEEKLVTWVTSLTQAKFGKTPLFSNEKLASQAGVQTLQTTLKDVQNLFKDKQTGHPLFKQILDGIEQGKYRISNILNEYKSEPFMVPGLNHIQARLLIDTECISNPAAVGVVHVYVYDRIPQELKDEYNAELDAIVEKIYQERIKSDIPLQPQAEEKKRAAEQELKAMCYARPSNAQTQLAISQQPAILMNQQTPVLASAQMPVDDSQYLNQGQ